MTCIPLISHHLFVAALSERNSARNLPVLVSPAFSAPEKTATELPVELVDFGRPLPFEAENSTGRWIRIVPVF